MRSMMFAALLPLTGVAAGATAAPAAGATRSYDVRDFTAVTLSGSDDVAVRVGPGFSIRAEGDPHILELLTITRDGDRLVVSRRRTSTWQRGSARVFVTLPTLAAVSLDGSGDLTVEQVRGATFDARLAGSGDLRIGQVATERLSLSLRGSGDVSAAGQTGRLAVQVTGSGDVLAGGLVARAAEVTLSGSGSVRAIVRGEAQVVLHGSGDIDLGDQARCTTRKAGSGAVRCGG